MNGKGISRIAVLSMSLLFLNLLIAISVFGNGALKFASDKFEAQRKAILFSCQHPCYVPPINLKFLKNQIDWRTAAAYAATQKARI